MKRQDKEAISDACVLALGEGAEKFKSATKTKVPPSGSEKWGWKVLIRFHKKKDFVMVVRIGTDNSRQRREGAFWYLYFAFLISALLPCKPQDLDSVLRCNRHLTPLSEPCRVVFSFLYCFHRRHPWSGSAKHLNSEDNMPFCSFEVSFSFSNLLVPFCCPKSRTHLQLPQAPTLCHYPQWPTSHGPDSQKTLS